MEGCQTKDSHLFTGGDDDDNKYDEDSASFTRHSTIAPLLDIRSLSRPVSSEGPATSPPSVHGSEVSGIQQQNLSNEASTSAKTQVGLESQHLPPDIDSLDLIQSSNAWQIESRVKKYETIPYRDWDSPLASSPLHQNEFLQKELGEAWTIPDDGRLPLTFSRTTLEQLEPELLEDRIRSIAKFRDDMKRDAFVDFKIIDNCQYTKLGDRSQMIYRLGQSVKADGRCRVPLRDEHSTEATTKSEYHDRNNDSESPWRRFMYVYDLLDALRDAIRYQSLTWSV
jgi:hypothetical protein